MTQAMTEAITERRSGAPVRSCAGCRRRGPRQTLLRYVADQAGRLRIDPLQRAPGRGVYLCADPACIEAACQRGALARGLRRKLVPSDGDRLRLTALEAVQRASKEAMAQGLTDGRVRAGSIEERLSRRLQILAEQARRLAETVSGRNAAGSGQTEVRDS